VVVASHDREKVFEGKRQAVPWLVPRRRVDRDGVRVCLVGTHSPAPHKVLANVVFIHGNDLRVILGCDGDGVVFAGANAWANTLDEAHACWLHARSQLPGCVDGGAVLVAVAAVEDGQVDVVEDLPV